MHAIFLFHINYKLINFFWSWDIFNLIMHVDAGKDNSLKFYDFLQVNSDSDSTPEDVRRERERYEDEEENKSHARFIDFLEVGSF